MQVFFNSRFLENKKPFGAIKAGDTISLVIAVAEGVFVEYIDVEIVKQDECPVYYRMEYAGKDKNLHLFKEEITIESEGIYWYRFVASTENGIITLGKGDDNNLTEDSARYYQQTVTLKDYRTPDHLKGGLIYHIFVDRFNVAGRAIPPEYGVLKKWGEEVTIVDPDGVFRANDFYGGNLDGITDKLDYLASLGVTLLYLSPIFKSSSNHRYDTGDYMQIDPMLGDELAFKRLIDEAAKRGIGIMLDGVFNHTGADSLYFNKFGHYPSIGAYQGIKSPFFDWYHFINYPDEYACWWGITVTPTVNKMIDSYRHFIMGDGGVLDKWTSFGLKGWRLDVVDELDKDFVTGIRNVVKAKNSEIAIIGEVWEDASTKIAYGTMRPYLLGYQLDGVMNYPFKEAIIDYVSGGTADNFINIVMDITENYPKDSLDSSMTLIGSHDTCRILSVLSGVNALKMTKKERLEYRLSAEERAEAKARLKIASALQYFLSGVPSIYYGDEIGMEGFDDPINRRCMAWDSIDNELLTHYKKLGDIRGKFRPLFTAEMELSTLNGAVIITRKLGGDKLILVANATDTDIVVSRVKGIDIISGKEVKRLTVKANDFRIINAK